MIGSIRGSLVLRSTPGILTRKAASTTLTSRRAMALMTIGLTTRKSMKAATCQYACFATTGRYRSAETAATATSV